MFGYGKPKDQGAGGHRKSVTLDAPGGGRDNKGAYQARSSFARRKSHVDKRATIYQSRVPEEHNYVGFYRHPREQLPAAIQAHGKFFPWPPKKSPYLSSGYYKAWYNMDEEVTHKTEFDTDTLRVHNVPDEITEEDIRSGFINDPAVIIGSTTYVKYQSEQEAKEAYKETKHLKIGQGDLLFLRGEEDDFYITNIPHETTEEQIRLLYPEAEEVRVVHNGPGGRSYAYLRYPNQEEKESAMTNGPLPLGQGGTVDGTDAVRRVAHIKKDRDKPAPNQVWVEGIPEKGVKESDFERLFPESTKIGFQKHKGFKNIYGGSSKYAVITFDTPEEAEEATKKVYHKWVRNIGPRKFQLLKNPNEAPDYTTKELETLTDEQLAKKLWNYSADAGDGADGADGADDDDDEDEEDVTDVTTRTDYVVVLDGTEGAGGGAKKKKKKKKKKKIVEHYEPVLTIHGLPKNITKEQLQQDFPEASDIQVQKEGSKSMAILTFPDPIYAAGAFARAKKKGWEKIEIVAPNSGGRVTRKSFSRKSTITTKTIRRKSSVKGLGRKKSRTSVSSKGRKSRTSRTSVGGKSRKSVSKRKKSKQSIVGVGGRKRSKSKANIKDEDE